MSKERHSRKKAREMLSKAGYKAGTHLGGVKRLIGEAVHEHDDQQHGGKKTKLRLKDGGCADGGKPKGRADRAARGGKMKEGKGKSHVTVNVINAHGGPKPPMMAKPPMPMPPPGAMAGPPGGMPPGGPPPGMGGPPPGGFKRGGRTRHKKRAEGGKASDSQREKINGMPDGHFRKGGKTGGSDPYAGSAHKPYPIDSGAAGAKARLDKIGLPMKRK